MTEKQIRILSIVATAMSIIMYVSGMLAMDRAQSLSFLNNP